MTMGTDIRERHLQPGTQGQSATSRSWKRRGRAPPESLAGWGGPASPSVWSLQGREAECLLQATSVWLFVPEAAGHCHAGRGDRPLNRRWDPLPQPMRTGWGGRVVSGISTPMVHPSLPRIAQPELSCMGGGRAPPMSLVHLDHDQSN